MKTLSLLLAAIFFTTSTLSASDELDLFLKNPHTEKQVCKLSEIGKDGRVPAADNCDTARELMSLNVAKSQFSGICKNIVKNDPLCDKLDDSKKLTCSSKAQNSLDDSTDSQVAKRAKACIKGFVIDSTVELVKFVGQMIKLLYNGTVNNAADIGKFFVNPVYRAQVMGRAGTATAKAIGKGATATAKAAPKVARKAGNLGEAFIMNTIPYMAREFKKNPAAALAKLDDKIKDFLLDSTEAIARFLHPEYDCMNGVAKVNTVCRLFGELVMPPTAVFALIKYGPKGVKAIANSPKMKRFRENFTALNGAKRTPPTPKQAVANSSLRKLKEPKKPAVVARAEKAKKPVNKMKEQELVALARAERAEARKIAAVEDEAKITRDLNAKSTQESEQILKALQERAIIAKGAAEGRKFPEVEAAIMNGTPSKPVEVNLSIMAMEDVDLLDEALRAIGAKGDGFPMESYPPQGIRTIKITSVAQAEKLKQLMKDYPDLFISAHVKRTENVSSVLAGISLPQVDDAAMSSMMKKPQYDSILLKVNSEKRVAAATALKVLEDGKGVKNAAQTYQKYEDTFKMVRARAPATDKTSEAYLAAFIVKQKNAGVTDAAIKKKIDEAFQGCK